MTDKQYTIYKRVAVVKVEIIDESGIKFAYDFLFRTENEVPTNPPKHTFAEIDVELAKIKILEFTRILFERKFEPGTRAPERPCERNFYPARTSGSGKRRRKTLEAAERYIAAGKPDLQHKVPIIIQGFSRCDSSDNWKVCWFRPAEVQKAFHFADRSLGNLSIIPCGNDAPWIVLPDGKIHSAMVWDEAGAERVDYRVGIVAIASVTGVRFYKNDEAVDPGTNGDTSWQEAKVQAEKGFEESTWDSENEILTVNHKYDGVLLKPIDFEEARQAFISGDTKWDSGDKLKHLKAYTKGVTAAFAGHRSIKKVPCYRNAEFIDLRLEDGTMKNAEDLNDGWYEREAVEDQANINRMKSSDCCSAETEWGEFSFGAGVLLRGRKRGAGFAVRGMYLEDEEREKKRKRVVENYKTIQEGVDLLAEGLGIEDKGFALKESHNRIEIVFKKDAEFGGFTRTGWQFNGKDQSGSTASAIIMWVMSQLREGYQTGSGKDEVELRKKEDHLEILLGNGEVSEKPYIIDSFPMHEFCPFENAHKLAKIGMAPKTNSHEVDMGGQERLKSKIRDESWKDDFPERIHFY